MNTTDRSSENEKPRETLLKAPSEVGPMIEQAYREGWTDGAEQAQPDERTLLERDWRRSTAKVMSESHLPYLSTTAQAVKDGQPPSAAPRSAPEGNAMAVAGIALDTVKALIAERDAAVAAKEAAEAATAFYTDYWKKAYEGLLTALPTQSGGALAAAPLAPEGIVAQMRAALVMAAEAYDAGPNPAVVRAEMDSAIDFIRAAIDAGRAPAAEGIAAALCRRVEWLANEQTISEPALRHALLACVRTARADAFDAALPTGRAPAAEGDEG